MKIAGINVSSKTVTLVIHRDGRMGKPCELKVPQDHATLSNHLRKAKVSRVCLEATGQYHLALALDNARLARVMINPKGDVDPHKTDAVDAVVLLRSPSAALHALAAPRRTWPWLSAPARRACARHIAALNKLHTQTKNQLHAAQQAMTTPDFLIASRHQSIAHLDAQIEHLRRQVLDLIRRMKRSGNPASCSSAPPVSPPPVPSSFSASCWSCPTTCVPSSGLPWPVSIHVSTRPAPA